MNLTESETALPRRVLLVDDNRDASSSLAELLRMLGHEVVVADDGPASLSLVDAGQAFDVALLDIGLPGMCGHELARLLRQRFSPSTLRLVALTGYGIAPGISARHHNGFDDYFVKPVDIDALQASIHEAPSASRTFWETTMPRTPAKTRRPETGSALHIGGPTSNPGLTAPSHGTEAALPHERDQAVGQVAREPDPIMVQAKRDIDAGLVDTDMRATPGLDAARRARLVPVPAPDDKTERPPSGTPGTPQRRQR